MRSGEWGKENVIQFDMQRVIISYSCNVNYTSRLGEV